MTGQVIFKKTIESIKEIKMEKTKIRIGENGTTSVVFDGDVGIVCDDGCVYLVCQDTTWVVDSTTSYHVTPQHDFFSHFTLLVTLVKLG